MKLKHFLTPYTKISQKWIKDLNVKPKTIKLLEENTARMQFDINQCNILFDSSPRGMETKTKINKWDLIKLKSFCTLKKATNKMRRQPSEQETITAHETTNKGLISKLYKQFMHLNTRKPNNLIKKWA